MAETYIRTVRIVKTVRSSIGFTATGLQMFRSMVVSTVWPIVGSMVASRVAVLSPKDISFFLWSRHKAGFSLVKEEWGGSSEWMRASSQLILFSSPSYTPNNLLQAVRGNCIRHGSKLNISSDEETNEEL